MIERMKAIRAAIVSATIALALWSGFAPPLCAQVKNPYAGDEKMAKLGEFAFRANCAFCHGLGARGGGRGPDLTRTPKKHGESDAEIFNTINNGVAGTAMPPNGATQQGVGMTEEEVWQVVTYIRSVEKKADAKSLGNAEHGKQLFYGAGVRNVPHGERKRRTAGAGFEQRGGGKVDGLFDGVLAYAEQAAGAGNFRGDEGIFARIRNGKCDGGGWNEICRRGAERRCVYAADIGHAREFTFVGEEFAEVV